MYDSPIESSGNRTGALRIVRARNGVAENPTAAHPMDRSWQFAQPADQFDGLHPDHDAQTAAAAGDRAGKVEMVQSMPARKLANAGCSRIVWPSRRKPGLEHP
jgi:hypothetical protein